MSQSIPSNLSFSELTAPNVNRFLTEELDGSIISVQVDSFLHFTGLHDQEVWDTPEWSSMMDAVKHDSEQNNLKAAWFKASTETSQYEPFCKWLEALITFATTNGPKRLLQREISFLTRGNKAIPATLGSADGEEVPGTSSSFGPDAACVLSEVTRFGGWYQVLVPLQFKRTDHPRPSKEAITAAASTSRSQSLDVPPASSSSRSHSNPKQPGDSDNENGPPAEKARCSHIACPSIQSGATQPNAPTLAAYSATRDDTQLARYAMETLAAVGDRMHVFGLAVNRPKVTLWYFDRCGAVCSPALDVNKSEDFLALIKFLSAIAYMEDAALGFNPFFNNSTGEKPGTRRDLCRMSVVIPGNRNRSLELLKVLDRRTGLVGRATLVHKAQLQEGEEDTVKRADVVIKSSWQHRNRKPEWEILKALYSNFRARDCIVELYHGWEDVTGSGQRAEFGKPTPTVVHDRALRHTVTEYLNPIAKLSEPFHILHIGWSVLQAIKFLNDMGWFHRDISIGNMGFVILPECGGVLVKLHDFDLSKHHDSTSGAPHWTGTLPFMSIELLKNPKAEYAVGFEVEALLWTLLWIVRMYKDGQEEHHGARHPLYTWFSNTYELVVLAANKVDYLSNGMDHTNNHYKSIGGQMQSFAELWYNMREAQRKIRIANHDFFLISEEAYGVKGLISVEAWMKEKTWNVPERSCSCQLHCAQC